MHNVLIVPGSPALVRELAPADEPSARLLDSARRAVAQAASRGFHRVHIVAPAREADSTAHEGSFAAWGASAVTVSAGHHLPELVARYVVEGVTGVYVSEVREAAEPVDPAVLTVIVVDGSAGLTARAPLALVDGGAWAHEWCKNLLGGAGIDVTQAWDGARLRESGVLDPGPWERLHALSASGRVVSRELIDHDDSLGVGRYVASWSVDGKESR